MHFKHHFFFEMWKMPGSGPPPPKWGIFHIFFFDGFPYLWDVFATTLSVLLFSWRCMHKIYYNYNYLQTILVMQNLTAKSRCRHDMMQICQCPWEITGTGAGAAICLTRDWGWLRQLARAIIEFPFVRVSFRLLGDCIQQAAMQHIYRDSRPLGSSIV